MSDLEADLELAQRAARAAGALLAERFGGPASGVELKSSRTDPVSDADRDAEVLLHETLMSERPDDGLLAEEGARSGAASGRCWIVDPLDGTTNFLYGNADWGVSVALEDEHGPAVGVVHVPVHGETFTAIRGAGARLGGRAIAVTGADALETALVATGFSYVSERRAEQARRLTALLPQVRDIRRAGAAALDLCSVACGRVDAFFERGLQRWDFAAGGLIAAEAGATVVELEGDPHALLAATPAIADGLRALVG